MLPDGEGWGPTCDCRLRISIVFLKGSWCDTAYWWVKAEVRQWPLYEMAEDGADVDVMEEGELWRPSGKSWFIPDAKIDGEARLASRIGMDIDVTSLSGGQRTKVLLPTSPWKAYITFGWADQLLRCWHIDWLKAIPNYENALSSFHTTFHL